VPIIIVTTHFKICEFYLKISLYCHFEVYSLVALSIIVLYNCHHLSELFHHPKLKLCPWKQLTPCCETCCFVFHNCEVRSTCFPSLNFDAVKSHTSLYLAQINVHISFFHSSILVQFRTALNWELKTKHHFYSTKSSLFIWIFPHFY
jgi:hypothetical protein